MCFSAVVARVEYLVLIDKPRAALTRCYYTAPEKSGQIWVWLNVFQWRFSGLKLTVRACGTTGTNELD